MNRSIPENASIAFISHDDRDAQDLHGHLPFHQHAFGFPCSQFVVIVKSWPSCAGDFRDAASRITPYTSGAQVNKPFEARTGPSERDHLSNTLDVCSPEFCARSRETRISRGV